MIRLFDIILSLCGLIIFQPLLIILLIFGLFDTGSPLIFQKRVGYKLKNFTLIKFRTMKIDTLELGTHLVDNNKITILGHILRKFKIDELPQLWNVLVGEMTIVGPRPCLLNQTELINERIKFGIYNFKPGLTGLSQITGVDMSDPKLLAKTDYEMIKKINVYNYLYYILLTIATIFKFKNLKRKKS